MSLAEGRLTPSVEETVQTGSAPIGRDGGEPNFGNGKVVEDVMDEFAGAGAPGSTWPNAAANIRANSGGGAPTGMGGSAASNESGIGLGGTREAVGMMAGAEEKAAVGSAFTAALMSAKSQGRGGAKDHANAANWSFLAWAKAPFSVHWKRLPRCWQRAQSRTVWAPS